MALQIIRNNIINVEADAIVNTANPEVAVGRGVDSAIYDAAGYEQLLAARAEIGELEPGEAAYTPAFGLQAKYVIHTVGPAWQGGGFGERETVAACYRNSLALAKELGCESIAFPLIATGTYGFPKDEALRIAIAEISAFLLGSEMEVVLVVYDKEAFRVSGKLFNDIRTFIGDSDVEEMPARNMQPGSAISGGSARKADPAKSGRRKISFFGRKRRKEEAVTPMPAEGSEASETADEDACYDTDPEMENEPALWLEESAEVQGLPYLADLREPASYTRATGSLDERLIHLDKTFQEYLFMLIDRKGLSDPDVYKKANIDRKHFSKIRSNPNYAPSKRTALALALALELNIDETKDLLARAGLALSPSIMFDMIIDYCIRTGNYDIYDINCILFKYDQQLLGA